MENGKRWAAWDGREREREGEMEVGCVLSDMWVGRAVFWVEVVGTWGLSCMKFCHIIVLRRVHLSGFWVAF